MTMDLATLTVQRITVMRLRIRLEQAALRAFNLACVSTGRTQQGNIGPRLVFALAHVPDAERQAAYRLAKLGRHVHSRCCDVLHGRMAGLSIPDVMIEEWTSVVERVEHLVSTTRTTVARG